MKPLFTLFALLLSIATVSAADFNAFSTFLAPAAAPVQTDSLPSGRHTVNSYRNGSSISVVVEDREIKSLKIDGKDVPEEEFDQHQDRVEELLGTSERRDNSNRDMRIYRWPDEDMKGLEERFEGLGNQFEKMGENFEFRFEGMGEDLERMSERLSQSLERMFEFGSDGNTMRFQFRSDGNGNWQMDSTGDGRTFEWHSDEWRSDGMDPKGLNREMPADGHSEAEAEIREMETMIEQMERRKSRMKADLERQKRDLEREDRDLERQERDMEREADRMVQQLQREGLIEDTGRLRKLTVDIDNLKVNGKKASKEGHARFLELYEQQTGRPFSKGSSISVKKD